MIRQSNEKRKVIFIDELSWMDTQNSDLMAATENFWNSFASAREDQVINLCEMKYSGSEYTVTEKVDRSIRNKINDLVLSTGTKYAIYPTLITTYGLVGNSYAENIQSVITLDDLFAI